MRKKTSPGRDSGSERLATQPAVVKVKAQALEIRQLFPRDREQRDLYFDDLSTGRSSAEEKGEGTTSPPAPAGSGPGA